MTVVASARSNDPTRLGLLSLDAVPHAACALFETDHGERLSKLMDGFMPDWRTRSDQLNAAPIADEDWPLNPKKATR